MQPGPRKKRLVTKTISVPANLARACDEFNTGKFYECHESIEEIWQMEQGPVRDAYKGLIQLAAAFVHLSRGGYPGAERLLRTGLGYLAPYRADGALGFDLEAMCRSGEDVHARLVAGGRSGVGQLDISRRPFYAFDRQKLAADARRWAAWGFDAQGNALEMEITVAE